MILTAEQIWQDVLLLLGYTPKPDECVGQATVVRAIAELREKLEASEAKYKIVDADRQLYRDESNFYHRQLIEAERQLTELREEYRIALATRDDEIARLYRERDELREPMACGHPKACWIAPGLADISVSVSHGAPAKASPPIWAQPSIQELQLGYCTACARENELREALRWALSWMDLYRGEVTMSQRNAMMMCNQASWDDANAKARKLAEPEVKCDEPFKHL